PHLHRAPRRHGPPRRGADLPAGPRDRADRRALPHGRGNAVLGPTLPTLLPDAQATMSTKSISLFDKEIMQKAVVDSFTKLDPRQQLKNPVMFITLIGAILTFEQLFTSKEPFSYVLQIALWLLFTVVFANFAEAVAEGRGKAQARALRASRKELVARLRRKDGSTEPVDASLLRRGDVVIVAAGELIPGDGEVIEGAASVDESALTGA